MDDRHHVHKPGPPPESGVCDFCGKPGELVDLVYFIRTLPVHVTIENPDSDHHVKSVILDIDPDWGACIPCAPLVQAQDIDGLVELTNSVNPLKFRRELYTALFAPGMIEHEISLVEVT